MGSFSNCRAAALMAAFSLTTASAVSDRYGAAYRTMPPTTDAITSWVTDAGPNVFLHQPSRASHRSTCFSFMVATPLGSRRRPKSGTVPLARKHTYGAAVFPGFKHTMIEWMRAVLA